MIIIIKKHNPYFRRPPSHDSGMSSISNTLSQYEMSATARYPNQHVPVEDSDWSYPTDRFYEDLPYDHHSIMNWLLNGPLDHVTRLCTAPTQKVQQQYDPTLFRSGTDGYAVHQRLRELYERMHWMEQNPRRASRSSNEFYPPSQRQRPTNRPRRSASLHNIVEEIRQESSSNIHKKTTPVMPHPTSNFRASNQNIASPFVPHPAQTRAPTPQIRASKSLQDISMGRQAGREFPIYYDASPPATAAYDRASIDSASDVEYEDPFEENVYDDIEDENEYDDVEAYTAIGPDGNHYYNEPEEMYEEPYRGCGTVRHNVASRIPSTYINTMRGRSAAMATPTKPLPKVPPPNPRRPIVTQDTKQVD